MCLKAVDNLEAQVETRRSGSMETVLQSLLRATNYSITVRARTSVGAGPASQPIFCTTHEDSKSLYQFNSQNINIRFYYFYWLWICSSRGTSGHQSIRKFRRFNWSELVSTNAKEWQDQALYCIQSTSEVLSC